jgi:hypothetical protein
MRWRYSGGGFDLRPMGQSLRHDHGSQAIEEDVVAVPADLFHAQDKVAGQAEGGGLRRIGDRVGNVHRTLAGGPRTRTFLVEGAAWEAIPLSTVLAMKPGR